RFNEVRDDIDNSVKVAQDKVGELKESSIDVRNTFNEMEEGFETFKSSVDEIAGYMKQIVGIADHAPCFGDKGMRPSGRSSSGDI
ncbi:MAG: hypothetical protein K5673_01575, partial [Lachnospiraceae bacterium]|nr:hypothetical protein [Lachnospiraceae bacterium]